MKRSYNPVSRFFVLGNKVIKKYLTLKLVTFVFLTFVVVNITALQLSYRPVIPLKALLFSNQNFPSSWQAGMESVSVQWELSKDKFSFKPNYSFYSRTNLGRSWGNELPNQTISQHLFLYDSPYSAKRQYIFSQPEIVDGDDWPNFVLSEHKHNRYPRNWQYQSPADDALVVCAMGRQNNCQLWFYWARYGQYILRIRFFAPNYGINEKLFFEIVAPIDQHVAEQLN